MDTLAVKPAAEELTAIKQFCSAEAARRATAEASAEAVKALRTQVKAAREALQKDMTQMRAKCVALSKADAKRLDAALPPYARIVQANKDAAVTPEVVQEAIESLTPDDLRETGAQGLAAVRAAVLQNIRRIVRSYTETLKLHACLQRGVSPYDVAEASPEMADAMYTLWTAEQALKRALEARKPPAEETKALSALRDRIEGFFVRTGLTAQRVVVEGRPYRLVRRVSVRKPRVGIGRVETLLDEVLKDLSGDVNTGALIHALQVQLSAIPPETKSSVVLCAVRAPDDS